MTAVIIPFPRSRTQLDVFSPDDIAELHRWASFVRPHGLQLLTAFEPGSLTESVVAQLSDGTQFASVCTEEGGQAGSFDIVRSRGQWVLKSWYGGEKIFGALRDALECISPTVVVGSPLSAG
jgi:hypothetical protein